MAKTSFLSVLGRNMLSHNHPGLLVLFVTDRCNCRCAMCFNAANVFAAGHAPEMSLKSIQKIARSLHPLPQLLLSGGEPFLRDDILGIIGEFYVNAGTRQFSIPTNGTLPQRIFSVCKGALDTYPDITLNLNLSLDEIGENHDQLRGLRGCYECVCETYALLQPLRIDHPGFSVNINTIITENTIKQAERIISDIRTKFTPNYHAVGILRPTPSAPTSEAMLLELSTKIGLTVVAKESFNARPLLWRIAPAIGALIRERYIRSLREQRRCFTCLGGRKIIVITTDGRLMPCEPLWLEGDIRKSPSENAYLMARLEDFDYDVFTALRSDQAERVKAFIARKECWCSWVCAIQNGILYAPSVYPLVLLKMLRNK